MPESTPHPSRNVVETAAECAAPAAISGLAAFSEGFAAPWVGWRFMKGRPGLWRYGVLPCLLNLIVTGVLLVGLVVVGTYAVMAMHAYFDGGWLWRVVEVFAAFSVLVAVFALAAVAWVVLQSVFCAYFYSKLAEQVELRLGMKPEDLREAAVFHQAIDAMKNAGFLVAANLGLLLLNVVPGVGAILAASGSFYFTCITLGFEYFEYPLALRAKRRPDIRAFVRLHRAHSLGLGAGVALVCLIPILNAVLLTTAVVGAVLLHRRIEASETTQ